MQASTVVIAAGERSIEAVLAAEALRRAARQQRVELAIEIRSNQGVTGALSDAQAAAATQLLLVGDGEADSARFGNAQIVRAGLGEVLDDPPAVLAQLAAASAPPSRDDAGKRIVADLEQRPGQRALVCIVEGIDAAERERQCDQQAAGSDERQHERHAGHQVLVGAGDPGLLGGAT